MKRAIAIWAVTLVIMVLVIWPQILQHLRDETKNNLVGEIHIGPGPMPMPETPLDLEVAASYARLDYLRQDEGEAYTELAHLVRFEDTPTYRCNNLTEQMKTSTDL